MQADKVLLSHNLFTYSFKWSSHKSLLLTINLHFSKESDFSGDFPPSLSTFPTYINMKFFIRVWISKRKSIRKTFRPLWGKGPPQAKNLLDLRIILWKIQRFWTKFCKLIWLNLANWTLYLSSFNKITSKAF